MNRPPTRRTGTSDRASQKGTGRVRPKTGGAGKSVRASDAAGTPPARKSTRATKASKASKATKAAKKPTGRGGAGPSGARAATSARAGTRAGGGSPPDTGSRIGSGGAAGGAAARGVQRDYRVRRSGMSLSVKFMLIVSGMVAGLMLLFFLTVYIIAAKALEDEISATGAAQARSLGNLGRVYIETIFNPDFVDSLLRRKDPTFRTTLKEEYYRQVFEEIRGSGPRGEFGGNHPFLRSFQLNKDNPDYNTVDEVLTDIARALIWSRCFLDPHQTHWDASSDTLAFRPPAEESLMLPAFRDWIDEWNDPTKLADYLPIDNMKPFRDSLEYAAKVLEVYRTRLQNALRQAYHRDFMASYVAPIINDEIAGVYFTLSSGEPQRVEQFIYPERIKPVEGRRRDVLGVWVSEGSGKVQFQVTVDANVDDGASAEQRSYIAAVMFDADKVNGARNRLVMFLAAIALLAVVIGICVSYFMANGVTKPINMLVEDVVNIAQGDYDLRTRMKTADEVGVLARTIDRMAEGLAEAREIAKERGKQQHDMSIAEEVVIHLLPDSLPKIYGYDVYAFYNPSKEVGGDYYDFFEIDPNHVGMIVADVSGKGIPGAMVMTMARSVIRYEAMITLSPRETFMRANTHIARDIKRGMFVTAFYLVLNTQTAEMTVASAGHNPLLLWRASSGKIENINPNGIALGFDKGPIFDRTIKEDKVQLYSGDRVVLYTDGVVEAMSPDNEEYTDERFIELIESYPDANSNQLTNIIVQDVMDHQGHGEQSDDITIVTFKLL